MPSSLALQTLFEEIGTEERLRGSGASGSRFAPSAMAGFLVPAHRLTTTQQDSGVAPRSEPLAQLGDAHH